MGVGVEGVGYVAALGGGLASRLGGQERGEPYKIVPGFPGDGSDYAGKAVLKVLCHAWVVADDVVYS